MKLSELKLILTKLETIQFKLPDGSLVPKHFHVTEIGKISKQFIDCGGNIRNEAIVNFQLWNADDYNHRLHPDKLRDIIQLSESIFEIGDLEIEVEYQGDTIEKFGLDYDGVSLLLSSKKTDCLAKENCGVSLEKKSLPTTNLTDSSYCSPESNCC